LLGIENVTRYHVCMSDKLVILGGGGHGKVVLESAQASAWAIVGVLDDDPAKQCQSMLGVPVLGLLRDLAIAQEAGATHFVLGLGMMSDASLRQRCVTDAIEAGLAAATIIAPSAYVSPSAEIGSGTVILPHAVVQAHARIGEHTILNTASVTEHDCEVGHHSHLATRATLTGNVKVGDKVLIGAASVVRQGLTIGAGATVGAGGVVIRDVPAGMTVVGNPARPFIHRKR